MQGRWNGFQSGGPWNTEKCCRKIFGRGWIGWGETWPPAPALRFRRPWDVNRYQWISRKKLNSPFLNVRKIMNSNYRIIESGILIYNFRVPKNEGEKKEERDGREFYKFIIPSGDRRHYSYLEYWGFLLYKANKVFFFFFL